MVDAVADLGAQKFVSLTTYKRSGEAVATPMWVAAQDGRLAFWTPSDSWKVKRARRDPRVSVAPCNRTGRFFDGHPERGEGPRHGLSILPRHLTARMILTSW